jgi:hypothetical protein
MEECDLEYERIRMTNKARNAAKSLAVCYHEYREAIRTKQPRAVSVWGNLLFIRQKEVGVNLVADNLLCWAIRAANEGFLFTEDDEGEQS